MNSTKQNYYRNVLLLGTLVMMLFVMGCSVNFTEIDFQSASNAMVSRESKNEEPGGLPGLFVKKVTGHKWALIYDSKKETAELKVSIVSWDEERYSLTDVHFNCEYTFEDSSKSGGATKVDLDAFIDPNGVKNNGGIKGAIEHCYDAANEPGVVFGREEYPSVQFEIIGEWEKEGGNVRGKVVEHESFDYFIDSSGGGSQSLFLSLDGKGALRNRKIQGESEAFSLNDKKLYAASNYDFWTSLIDSPKGQLSFVEHYVWNDSGKMTHYSPKQDVDPKLATILLEPSTLTITPPQGFILDKFIVDPKNWQPGGG